MVVDPVLAALVPVAAMGVALGVDRVWGEPPVRVHPVVGMGAILSLFGRWVAPLACTESAGRWWPWLKGAVAWLVGGACVLGVAMVLGVTVSMLPVWLQMLCLGLLLKPLLAWRMLVEEVQAVEAALSVSLDAGRSQLARLVSRDVSALDETAVREAALSTLSENLNDSVVAPLFWFALAGLPGAALYRWANTADAMWGYRGERQGRIWTWAGSWAARADDVLSWVPARLTAMLLLGFRGLPRWGTLRQLALLTPSPNGGWPMGALALMLGVSLGKTGVYRLNAGSPPPQPRHVALGVSLCARAVGRGVLFLGLLAAMVISGTMLGGVLSP